MSKKMKLMPYNPNPPIATITVHDVNKVIEGMLGDPWCNLILSSAPSFVKEMRETQAKARKEIKRLEAVEKKSKKIKRTKGKL